jgi:hypothetical protein
MIPNRIVLPPPVDVIVVRLARCPVPARRPRPQIDQLVEIADTDDDAEESGYGGSSDNLACEVRENAGFNDCSARGWQHRWFGGFQRQA